MYRKYIPNIRHPPFWQVGHKHWFLQVELEIHKIHSLQVEESAFWQETRSVYRFQFCLHPHPKKIKKHNQIANIFQEMVK